MVVFFSPYDRISIGSLAFRPCALLVLLKARAAVFAVQTPLAAVLRPIFVEKRTRTYEKD